MSYKIIIYDTENGSVPFESFMDSIEPKMRAKILRDLDLLEAFGPALRGPYSKKLNDDIFELRSISGKNISRTLYFFDTGQTIVVTHGFVKKQRKTPRNQIEKAKRYRKDWIQRKENGLQGTEEQIPQ